MKGQLILVADLVADHVADSGAESIESTDGTEATSKASPASRSKGRQMRLRQANVRRERPEWRLDDRTRAVGRRGIKQARAALRASSGRRPAA
jgi:hypothetical protein